ncbi:hypothetical protein IWQ57_005007 [Coemansia nantahalensis]|uniref:Uncharacterized protein n=1 Tax=Coemansia nantahalensis TaxID=2789366 RepID=A0ACC1JPQ2_9FUNG|nr:hypothetical protein IWQ57_005007 [Coemansia nantahalensis]
MALVASAADTGTSQPLRTALPKAQPVTDPCWKQLLADKIILGVREHTMSIGRSSTSTVQIGSAATTISRKHAEIYWTSRGCYELRVVGINGVRVNGTLYGRDASVELCSEDELNFVGIRYRFRTPASDAAASAEAEEWWPEPVRKHAADSADCPPGPPHKRARILASSASDLLYHDSTDTLVGGSEASPLCADGKQPEPAPQRLLLDDLPPSSPPPMHALSGFFCAESEDEDEGADDLPDALDIESLTPMRSMAATPQATTPQAAECTPVVLPDECAQMADLPAPVADRLTAKESKKNKENSAATGKVDTAAAGKESTPKAAKATRQRKPRKSAGEHGKAAGHKHDDEMMASLRELLGIVDPSECLADSIDGETEMFLTTQPEEPIELSAGASLTDVIIQTMVFSARTSHTVSDLLRDIAQMDGHEGQARVWRHHLVWTLFHTGCFGRVERRVKDASDRRAEDRWYYDAAKDDCVERRENFGGLVRTARRCTLRDTQYFFKQVPKLPSFRYR